MATKQDGRSFLDKVTSPAILMALAGLIVYQGSDLRSEIRGLRGEFRGEFSDLRGEFSDLRGEVGDLRKEVGAEVGDLRGEVGNLRKEVGNLRKEVGDLRGEVGDLRETVYRLEVAVARIEARDSLRLALGERFSATGEGASYGGPIMAADILLARALPEIDAALSTLDKDAQTELADDLWEDRANILARADPVP